MKMPRNYAIEHPEFGTFLTLEGWAVWALFPKTFCGSPRHPMMTEFARWCSERGIPLDIARLNRHCDFEYGGIVRDERLATEFRMRWSTPEFA